MNDSAPPPPLPETNYATTQSVPDRRDDDIPRVFPCEQCGADLRFNIGVQSLKCPYCGFVKQLEINESTEIQEQDFDSMLARLADKREQKQDGDEEIKKITCTSCGGSVEFTGTLTSSECAYCGVTMQIDKVHTTDTRIPVDGLLAFTVPREQARTNLAQWVKSRWFAPNDLKARGVQGRFNGIYLPYWTFDSMTATRYSGMRGEHYWVTVGSGKNRRQVRRTRWYPASGAFQRFFDDVLVVAATGLPEKRVNALEPWPLAECTPFNSQVLAGFLARTYDISLNKGFGHARIRIEHEIEADVRARIGGDTQQIHSIDTRFDAITYKHLLLPVWMLAYRYRDKTYQVVVNATTGEVQGDRPYSWIKITLTALAAIAVAAVIFVFSQGT